MGSYHMFHKFTRYVNKFTAPCYSCGESSILNFCDELCIQCENVELILNLQNTGIFKQLFKTKNLPGTFVESLLRYLKPMLDPDAEFRRLYLRIMLLGPPSDPSPFRKMTYFGNGILGNISDTADILDRVLAFAV